MHISFFRIILINIFLILSCGISHGATDLSYEAGNYSADSDTTITKTKKPNFLQKVGKGIMSFIREFNTYDTVYIEPQHFKFQAMGQLSVVSDQYTLKSGNNINVTLSPEVSTTFGPYVGYSLIFLGYTLQLNNLYLGNTKKTFNLSLYSSLAGFDFYYRNNSNFNIKRLTVEDSETGEKFKVSPVEGADFDGLKVNYWGFNTYYIFNHRCHSYPAAYNQSTCQKRSAGSPLVGFGYGKYNMSMDWGKLEEFSKKKKDISVVQQDTDSLQNDFHYNSYSLYGGYSYNWVFARNWLVGASATLAISYNKTKGDLIQNDRTRNDFSISNFSLDGIGRMGIVWNNTRFFAGASGQIHSYSYSKEHISINNLFGTLNVYVGINFGKKKEYRKPDRFFEF